MNVALTVPPVAGAVNNGGSAPANDPTQPVDPTAELQDRIGSLETQLAYSQSTSQANTDAWNTEREGMLTDAEQAKITSEGALSTSQAETASAQAAADAAGLSLAEWQERNLGVEGKRTTYDEAATKAGEAQDAPDYAGVDVSGVDTPEFDRYDESGQSKYIRDSETVRGQLTSLLDTDSKYLEQARIKAREGAQGRGMLNTSVAAGAAEQAAIQEGFKIASQDAKAYSDSGLLTQQSADEAASDVHKTELNSALTIQEAGIAHQNKQLDNAFQVAVKGMDTEQQVLFSAVQDQYNTNQAQIKAKIDKDLLTMDHDSKTKLAAQSSFNTILVNDSMTWEKMMLDGTIQELMATNPAAVNALYDNLHTQTVNKLTFTANSLNLNMTNQIDAIALGFGI